MRPIPILTALAAIGVLFLLVFQRDTLRGIAGFEPEPAAAVAPAPDTSAAGDAMPEGVSVIAIASTAREIDSAVVLRGRTEAARTLDLMAETSGKVVSPAIPKGRLVTEGDVLCEIDMGTREAALAQAQAARDEAALVLRNAEALAADGFAAETRVASARAAMEAAGAAVAQAERDIANTRITAPFDGVLESDTAEPGSLLMAGSPCARLIDLDPIRLVGFVAEVDVERIAPGAQVGARLSTGREVPGRVTFVSRSADSATRTFRVEAEVANADLSIRDGQTAEILIRSEGRMAHLLPQSALTLDDAGTLGVRIAEPQGAGHVARFVPVELLRDTREGVWVAGLADSATVIVSGQDYVTDGVALAVTMRESGT
ncbi:efflux RND transporter periplasmic adaptor subunit [Sinisalibacter aestuarii]|uniref:Hemolysin D n=1 Tax=Sinisalibacter aestuarii TaxID=2949426 RepID=A0ABQ5LWQ3_9RHOB|nr:efflux RND transporter periplasmic adaptor subunit [Sinisalibacter aestuarii]GKY89043.1 hemolysin D [Sinisalibacter aestuarii]